MSIFKYLSNHLYYSIIAMKRKLTKAVRSVGDQNSLDGGHVTQVDGPPRPRLVFSAGAAFSNVEFIVRVAVHSVARSRVVEWRTAVVGTLPCGMEQCKIRT